MDADHPKTGVNFACRSTPLKQWKLSPMDLKSYSRWYDYSRARDDMFAASDTAWAPWYVVKSNDKKRARLNCISHILRQIPYQDILPEPIELPHREDPTGYVRPPFEDQTFVPDAHARLMK